MKDFDSWNNFKKYINNDLENKFYHPRDIWWCSLGLNIGYEQDGTGKKFERPVLILKGFNKFVCLVVPLTTSEKKNKYLLPVDKVDNKEAQAIVSQVRLVDTKRLSNKIDVLNKEKFEEIRKAIKDLL